MRQLIAGVGVHAKKDVLEEIWVVDEVGKLIHYVVELEDMGQLKWRTYDLLVRVPLVLAEVEVVVTKGAWSLYNEIVASMYICGETCVDLVVMEELLNSYGKSKCYSGSLFFM